MVKLYLKEEGLWRRYENVPAFVAKATKGIKQKDRKKTLGLKFSLLNGIPNIHILLENVIFVKFGGNA